HELPDHAFLSEHLRDRKNQVRRRSSFAQPAVKLEAHHFRHEHRERLAQHGGLRFNSANAPAEHAQRIHHRSVRIRADERIRIGFDAAATRNGTNHSGEILDIDLVTYARIGWHDLEIAEGGLPPAQEGIALDVALEFEFRVHAEGVHI